MSFENSRYVAEIEIPEGYISIDCETEFGGDVNVLKFYLNQISVDRDNYLLQNPSKFKKELLTNLEFELLTERDEIEKILREIMIKEFGTEANIHISDVDSD